MMDNTNPGIDQDSPESSVGWSQVLKRLVHTERKRKRPLSRALRDGVKEKKTKPIADETKPQTRPTQIKETLRKKPDLKDREYERHLQSIATKGVVQLFNAIKEFNPQESESKPKPKLIKKDEPINKFISQWGELKDEEDEDAS
ncbi:RRP15-like protein [Brevipalpus obovatus]|uniref:RRP15-like protein n=1 Tax=Brevipalpus obovatus TaxID=246614 RepID=UPI003D9F3A2D